jgi:MshEN domain
MSSDLATLLLREQLLTRADLARVNRERGQRPLWVALRDAELASEDQIHQVLDASETWRALSEDQLASAVPPIALLDPLPPGHAIAWGLLPIEFSPDRLHALVAMVDPSDRVTLEAYRTAAGLAEVRPLLAPPRALQTALRRVYGINSASVELDPGLTEEIAQPPPIPPEPPPIPPEPPVRREPKRPAARKPPPTSPDPRTATDERLIRALTEVVETLAGALEARLGARPRALDLARLSRSVARRLDCPRGAVDEIGVVAALYAVDRALRFAHGQPTPGGAAELLESLGWSAAGEGGIAPALRSLLAASSAFGVAGSPGPPPLAARVVTACADYLELEFEADKPPDRDTVSQLLRAGPATAPVVDALLDVLDLDTPTKGKD